MEAAGPDEDGLFRADDAEALLRTAFAHVERRDPGGSLTFDHAAAVAYLESGLTLASVVDRLPEDGWPRQVTVENAVFVAHTA